MKRKSIAFLLSLVMLLSLLTPTALAEEPGQEGQVTEETQPTEPTTPAENEEETPSDPGEETPAEDSLYQRLMACTTLEELETLLDAASEEEWNALTEEQQAAVEALLASLEPAPLPPVTVEPSEPPVVSEVEQGAVNFTEVAPFLEPVQGENVRSILRAALMSAVAAYGAAEVNETAGNGEEADNGIRLNKTATANSDGSYTITLEAYATGEKTISTVTKDVPTDIVLVLDLSSSMKDKIGTVNYNAYNRNNEDLYALRHNGGEGNLWYKVGDSYYSVSVTAEGRTVSYTDASSYNNSKLYDNSNNLYAQINGEYVKVTVDCSGKRKNYTYTYTYGGEEKTVTSSGDNNTPGFDTDVTLHVRSGVDTTNATYTYTYTDSTGTHDIITSTGGTATPTDKTFYSRSTSTSGGESRLAALKAACNTFAEEVAKKAKGADGVAGTTDDVQHRIAVVGFNSSGTRYTGTSNNTALIDMNTLTGETTIKNAVSSLGTGTGTNPADGLSIANSIFEEHPVAGTTRNRVVVFFTDGYPSTSGATYFDYDLANAAITQAKTAKNTYGATVYSIAVIADADPTQAGADPGTNLEKGTSDACNWYLHNVSSNNGKPQTPGYYLSAADADSLNNIFKQISDQIEDGGSASTLTSDAVVKDIISPQFTLPAGATADNITLETYKCTGKTDGNYTWEKNSDAMGATATVDGDQVSVTGFNFSENYVGTVTENGNTTYRGHKLVISFKVQPKAGFLGGNDVYTNASAGVYENSSAEDATLTFDRPQVNVPIKDVTVGAKDENVYVMGGVTADQLKKDATVTVGGVTLKLNETNYGLESWQTAYVDITVTVTDKHGNVISDNDLNNLTNDVPYTVTVAVAPKTATPSTTSDGTPATAKSGSDDASINVFKPVITWQDSQIDLGETANYETQNFVSAEWKHGETKSTDTGVDMIGTEPELNYAYTPGADFKQDTPVKVTVMLGDVDISSYVTFKRLACSFDGCTWKSDGIVASTDNRVNFIVHIKSFDLTIVKAGWNTIDENQSFIFEVTGPNNYRSTVTVQGNGSVTIKGLKVGNYTVTEETGWSWRYAPDKTSYSVTPSSVKDGKATVTVTNTRPNTLWLNGCSLAVNNWARTQIAN